MQHILLLIIFSGHAVSMNTQSNFSKTHINSDLANLSGLAQKTQQRYLRSQETQWLLFCAFTDMSSLGYCHR